MTTEAPTHRFLRHGHRGSTWFHPGWNLRARTTFIVSAAGLTWFLIAWMLLSIL
jgi:hypothetical protein